MISLHGENLKNGPLLTTKIAQSTRLHHHISVNRHRHKHRQTHTASPNKQTHTAPPYKRLCLWRRQRQRERQRQRHQQGQTETINIVSAHPTSLHHAPAIDLILLLQTRRLFFFLSPASSALFLSHRHAHQQGIEKLSNYRLRNYQPTKPLLAAASVADRQINKQTNVCSRISLAAARVPEEWFNIPSAPRTLSPKPWILNTKLEPKPKNLTKYAGPLHARPALWYSLKCVCLFVYYSSMLDLKIHL